MLTKKAPSPNKRRKLNAAQKQQPGKAPMDESEMGRIALTLLLDQVKALDLVKKGKGTTPKVIPGLAGYFQGELYEAARYAEAHGEIGWEQFLRFTNQLAQKFAA